MGSSIIVLKYIPEKRKLGNCDWQCCTTGVFPPISRRQIFSYCYCPIDVSSSLRLILLLKMDKADVTLKNACVALENLIDSYKNRLAALDEEIQAKSGSYVSIPRSDVERASINAAIENLKHSLATFQSEIKTLDKSSAYHCKYQSYFYLIFIHVYSNSLNSFECTVYPDEILSNVSKLCQAESSTELQAILVQEKLRQTALKEEIKK